eukprot:Tbor_TRINITY_DN7704_c0_g1::TRINITY_DN7704_c0_g1_i1::g.12466::m.12466
MMFPGLCAEAPSVSVRIFLGSQPTMNVEKNLIKSIQGVHSWFSSRKRVKDAGNEFLDLDSSSIDTELLLRHSHVFFVRRHVVQDMIDKQFSLLDQGKPAKAVDPAILSCLKEGHAETNKALEQELFILSEKKKTLTEQGRRELDPTMSFESSDILSTMRCVEEDIGCPGGDCDEESSVVDREAMYKARSFLPLPLVQKECQQLIRLFNPNISISSLDKKEMKLLMGKVLPCDYSKIGCIQKLFPYDVSAYYRFVGERLCGEKGANSFKRYLWGNIFRRFASHPSYLCQISQYWSIVAEVDSNPPVTILPTEIANLVCRSQQLFPAIKYHTLYMYSSPEVAREHWRSDVFVPNGRLFPFIGANACDELLAEVLVDAFWKNFSFAPTSNILEDEIIRSCSSFVSDVSSLYGNNLGALLLKASDSIRVAVSPIQVLKATDDLTSV